MTDREWILKMAEKEDGCLVSVGGWVGSRLAEMGRRIQAGIDADLPTRGHEGACTPESGCDYTCAEFAAVSLLKREATLALAELLKAGRWV